MLYNGVEIRTCFQVKNLQVSRISPCVRDFYEILALLTISISLAPKERSIRGT